MPLLPVMCTGPPAAPLPSCLFPPRHVRRTSYSLARPVSHIVSCEWAAAKQGAASSVQGLGCGVLPSTVASPSRPSAASSSSSSSATAHLISLGVRHYQPLQAEGAGAGPWDPMNPFGYVPMPHQHQGGEAPFVPLWPPAPAPAAAAVAAVEPAAAEAAAGDTAGAVEPAVDPAPSTAASTGKEQDVKGKGKAAAAAAARRVTPLALGGLGLLPRLAKSPSSGTGAAGGSGSVGCSEASGSRSSPPVLPSPAPKLPNMSSPQPGSLLAGCLASEAAVGPSALSISAAAAAGAAATPDQVSAPSIAGSVAPPALAGAAGPAAAAGPAPAAGHGHGQGQGPLGMQGMPPGMVGMAQVLSQALQNVFQQGGPLAQFLGGGGPGVGGGGGGAMFGGLGGVQMNIGMPPPGMFPPGIMFPPGMLPPGMAMPPPGHMGFMFAEVYPQGGGMGGGGGGPAAAPQAAAMAQPHGHAEDNSEDGGEDLADQDGFMEDGDVEEEGEGYDGSGSDEGGELGDLIHPMHPLQFAMGPGGLHHVHMNQVQQMPFGALGMPFGAHLQGGHPHDGDEQEMMMHGGQAGGPGACVRGGKARAHTHTHTHRLGLCRLVLP